MAKPTEVRKLAALLEQDAESSEDMAKKAWDLVEDLIAAREQYVVVVIHPSLKIIQCVGPYATENQLRKDYGKRIHAYDNNSKAHVAKLRHPDTINLD